MNAKHTEPDPITLQASDWVSRSRQGLLSSSEQMRFRQWRAADPRHEQAVRQVEHSWAVAEGLRNDPEFRVAAKRPRRLSAWHWGAAASLLLAIGLWSGRDLPLRLSADYQTAIGEVRTIRLADGSRIELGSRSALALNYSEDERRVRLLRGEAIFTPSPVEQGNYRPFVVEAAGATSTALGTQYAVRITGTQSGWVGVLQHSVRVSLQPAADSSPADTTVVREGQSVSYDPGSISASNLDLTTQTSWRNGMLIFKRERLGDVIERLNQYHEGQIVLVGNELRDKTISAAFPITELDKALTTLERELSVKTLKLPGLSLIY